MEQMAFEEVDYWEELCMIMEWSKKHVTSTLHICWGAQAGLYYHFGLPKIQLREKLFGIFEHKVMNRKIPLVRGFDDYFMAPNSRYTTVSAKAIHDCPQLIVLAESEEAGVLLCMTENGKQIFVMGHLEYDRVTLQKEYERDLAKGLSIKLPVNYFPEDDPTKRPRMISTKSSNMGWNFHDASFFISNYLNLYEHQSTYSPNAPLRFLIYYKSAICRRLSTKKP